MAKKRQIQRCRECGCTDANCFKCIVATGGTCHWVYPDLCSRCHAEKLSWISLEESLPDADINVIISCPDEDPPVWIGCLDDDEWKTAEGATVRVTHWRDFPAPPDAPKRRSRKRGN